MSVPTTSGESRSLPIKAYVANEFSNVRLPCLFSRHHLCCCRCWRMDDDAKGSESSVSRWGRERGLASRKHELARADQIAADQNSGLHVGFCTSIEPNCGDSGSWLNGLDERAKRSLAMTAMSMGCSPALDVSPRRKIVLIRADLYIFANLRHTDRRLHRTMLSLTLACCYLMWAITYLAQLHPLIGESALKPGRERSTAYSTEVLVVRAKRHWSRPSEFALCVDHAQQAALRADAARDTVVFALITASCCDADGLLESIADVLSVPFLLLSARHRPLDPRRRPCRLLDVAAPRRSDIRHEMPQHEGSL